MIPKHIIQSLNKQISPPSHFHSRQQIHWLINVRASTVYHGGHLGSLWPAFEALPQNYWAIIMAVTTFHDYSCREWRENLSGVLELHIALLYSFNEQHWPVTWIWWRWDFGSCLLFNRHWWKDYMDTKKTLSVHFKYNPLWHLVGPKMDKINQTHELTWALSSSKSR